MKFFDIKNWFDWTPIKKDPKDIKSYLTRTNLARFRQDVEDWKQSISEAERQILPYRVKMVKLYNQAILNDHVTAVMEKRINLTLLKEFALFDESGEEDEEATKIIKDKVWFDDIIKYALEALFHGFSLIQIGDIINGEIAKVELIRRRNISPDREILAPFEYSPNGVKFTDPEFFKFCVWVTTPSDIGESPCGYGLLYKIALLELFMRNNITFNANFVELFSQPIRWAKTNKNDGPERDNLENAMSNMGNSAYIITDTIDEITLLDSSLGGNGYKGYESFQKRLEDGVTKMVLGHAAAMSPEPGKLGSDENVSSAINTVEKKDNKFITSFVNNQLLPKLRDLGYSIPDNVRFGYKNSKELLEGRKSESELNKLDADVFLSIYQAGGTPDWKYFSERTGIKTELTPPPEPASMAKPDTLKKALNKIYL